ncbi:hypothetical protein HRbin06_00089 [archaeon HR06]|nr:hypothetical protein HRbin06_00089 [archaeon HR06]
MRRVKDWLRQSEAALSQAKDSLKGNHFWSSCFFSHQAAEYAAKALLESKGVEMKGHSVFELLEEARRLGLDVGEDLFRKAIR